MQQSLDLPFRNASSDRVSYQQGMEWLTLFANKKIGSLEVLALETGAFGIELLLLVAGRPVLLVNTCSHFENSRYFRILEKTGRIVYTMFLSLYYERFECFSLSSFPDNSCLSLSLCLAALRHVCSGCFGRYANDCKGFGSIS